ncbi:bleomycin hydrolase [Gonapodya sp. JEL0774]|nr:bleomycin hydrolase [Gonapodya sp. JEL0774]
MSVFSASKYDALIVGVHSNASGDSTASTLELSEAGTQLLSEPARKHILSSLTSSRWKGKKGEARTLFGVKDVTGVDIVAVVGLGKKTEDGTKNRETARSAAAAAISSIRALSSDTVFKIATEDLSSAFGAAEGAFLSQYSYDELKDTKSRVKFAEVELVGPVENPSAKKEWVQGSVYAEGQNIARRLAETPANLMTPTIFAEEAKKVLGSLPVEIIVRDKPWMEEKGMGSFLSVSQGSAQPPKIVEYHYKGGATDAKPVLLVGKGVTFDSGGISLKPAADMAAMRGGLRKGLDAF